MWRLYVVLFKIPVNYDAHLKGDINEAGQLYDAGKSNIRRDC